MAMMAKMRSLAPAFILTVGVLFVLFMVISDSNVMEALGGRSNNVGSINGEAISYTEFNLELDKQKEIRKQQTGQDIEEEQMDQFRDQVWESLVNQKLLEQQMKKLGITVSDEELKEVILGDNPPDFLKQGFIDSAGNFNRSLYQQAIQDPRNREPLIEAEKNIRQMRLGEKLQSMLFATINVSEADIKRKFIDQNITINAQYALVDINKMPDSEVKVTDEDIKAYYNEHQEKYKIEAQRKLKYVLFQNVASEEDSSAVKASLDQIIYQFKKDTATFQQTVETYSALQFMKDTLNASAIPEEVLDRITKADKGSIIGPIATSQGMSVYRLLDVVPSTDTYVRASHILINQFGSDEKNLEEANKVYEQLVAGASFEKLAKERSASPEGQSRGGDLGWFGKGMMVPEFESAAMSGQVGVIQKPVKTNYGYHIIKTTGKISSKFAVEWVTSPLKASASTIQNNFDTAGDFAYIANDRGFESEAKLMKYNIQETPPFVEESSVIPGLGANKRLVEFAFDNSVNTVSDKPFRVASGYVVVKVSDAIKEGVKPLAEVKEQIKPLVAREKKFEKAKRIIEDVQKKINGNLAEASKYNQYIVTNQTGNFTPGGTVPTVGRDFAFIEKALNSTPNKVVGPFKGQRGYYLLNVTERSQFDATAYGIQRNMLRDNLLQEKRGTYFNQWLAKLKKEADIEDNRYMFFGQ